MIAVAMRMSIALQTVTPASPPHTASHALNFVFFATVKVCGAILNNLFRPGGHASLPPFHRRPRGMSGRAIDGLYLNTGCQSYVTSSSAADNQAPPTPCLSRLPAGLLSVSPQSRRLFFWSHAPAHAATARSRPRRGGSFYYTLSSVQQTEGTNNPGANNHIFSRKACGGSNCNGSFISQYGGGDHDGVRVLGALHASALVCTRAWFLAAH